MMKIDEYYKIRKHWKLWKLGRLKEIAGVVRYSPNSYKNRLWVRERKVDVSNMTVWEN